MTKPKRARGHDRNRRITSYDQVKCCVFLCKSGGRKRRRHEAHEGRITEGKIYFGPPEIKRRLGPTILLTKSTIEKKKKILTQLTEDLVFDVAKIDADTVNWLSTHPQLEWSTAVGKQTGPGPDRPLSLVI